MIQSFESGSLQTESEQTENEISSHSFPSWSHSSTSSNNISKGTCVNRRCVYVCTFCQVFSPSEKTVVDHIAAEHKSSLLLGTTAENFVSKLQALQDERAKETSRKIGRPKKCEKQSQHTSEDKLPNVEPSPGPDGFYWCQKCHRFFKKSRQLSRHICHELDEDSFSDENSIDSDGSTDFRVYTILDPLPWSRRCKVNSKNKNPDCLQTTKSNVKYSHTEDGSVDQIMNRNSLNWRHDPSYIPLFKNDGEKLAFEEHLKSVDYSWVDNMFVKEEKVSKKKKTGQGESSSYSCNVCHKVLKSLSHIRMHCIIHTDIKPFTCPKCPYQTNAKGSLYSHMRSHTGNIFKCSQCDFQSIRRAHVIDHEATHSSISQLCKLCKNSYKTLKSLIAHVRKYHNNPGGKKYMKSLTSKHSKETFIKCSICQKKFKSTSSFESHNEVYHSVPPAFDDTRDENENMILDNSENLPDSIEKGLELIKSPNVPQPNILQCQSDVVEPKDSLAAIVLNDLLLQHKDSEDLICDDIFVQSQNQEILPAANAPLSRSFQTEPIVEKLSSLTNNDHFHPKTSMLVECEKTLDLEILDECLKHSNFTDECIAATCPEASGLIDNSPLSDECHQQFDLSEVDQSFTNETILQKEPQNPTEILPPLHKKLIGKKGQFESKSAETKLFEKCRRAPAYVCCVCSAIYICPSTLKVHLKEHVYNTSSSIIEQPEEDFDPTKISETENELDNVCGMLPDTCDEKELEKLYTSSLDMMWYLPEVSVVLENDAALIDSMLEDISNFPLNEKFDESADLAVKTSNEIVCFEEL